MDPKLAAEAREALLGRREALRRRRAAHEEEGRLARSRRVCDPMERADLTREEARYATLGEADARRLREVDEALARLDAGTWGTCAVCEEEIDPQRLRRLPEARLCLACARER